jgi:ABC-type maltose transport system permease subunit
LIDRREQLVNYAILGFFSLVALYPIVGILSTALSAPGSSAGFHLSTDLHFSNFSEAWTQGHFSQYLRSSAIVAVSVVAVSTVLSILSGYAFGLMRFRGATALFYVFLLGLMVPIEAMIVPLYFDLRDLGLTDTYWALILPQIGLSVAFGTFWMRAFFLSTPRSLVEAARIDERVHVDVERVPARARDGLEREPAHRAARPRVLPGPAHIRPDPARRGRGDRGHAGRGRLRLPPAPLHPRDADGSGEGLVTG